jgi:hypothetical protein
MRHQLSLEIPEVTNTKILRVFDTTVYSSALPVKCGRLEITVPGFTKPAVLDAVPGFILNLTTCDLGLQNTGCDQDTGSLPDGIYIIRFSVSPNDKSWVEYNFLRITDSMNKYFEQLSRVEVNACDPLPEIKKQLRELQLVRSFLDAAKAKVEYGHEPKKGMELFHYANSLLKKIQTCHRPC